MADRLPVLNTSVEAQPYGDLFRALHAACGSCRREGADRLDALVETPGLRGEARAGGGPAATRAGFMTFVQPHLLGALEQAFFIAGRLSSILAPHVVEEDFARIDALLEVDGSGLAIEAIVECQSACN